MKILEAIDKLIIETTLDDIRFQNKLAITGTTIAGAGIGAILGDDSPAIGAGIGGILGLATGNFATSGREENFQLDVIFGPYSKEIVDFRLDCVAVIEHISNIHKDYTYKNSEIKIMDKFEKCASIDTFELTEKIVLSYRRCVVTCLSSLMKIIEEYIKEKRAHLEVVKIYKNVLIPRYKVIEHYLLKSKIKDLT